MCLCLPVSLCVSLCVCGIIYSLNITQPYTLLYTTDVLSLPPHQHQHTGEQGTAGSAGTFNFQTAIVIMNSCFLPVFLILFRWIVILSTDIRLGVKNGGFIFR